MHGIEIEQIANHDLCTQSAQCLPALVFSSHHRPHRFALLQQQLGDRASYRADPPVNGIVEIGGPEQFRLDELVRRRLATLKDSREVIADPKALYSGARVSERTLVPGNNARLGETRFETWLTQPAAQIPKAT